MTDSFGTNHIYVCNQIKHNFSHFFFNLHIYTYTDRTDMLPVPTSLQVTQFMACLPNVRGRTLVECNYIDHIIRVFYGNSSFYYVHIIALVLFIVLNITETR